jgi:hypothetical protein
MPVHLLTISLPRLAIPAPFGAFLQCGLLRRSIIDKVLTDQLRSNRSKMWQVTNFFNNICDVGATNYLDTGPIIGLWCNSIHAQRYWVFGLCPSSGFFLNNNRKNTTFRKLDLFPSSGEGRHLLCWVP